MYWKSFSFFVICVDVCYKSDKVRKVLRLCESLDTGQSETETDSELDEILAAEFKKHYENPGNKQIANNKFILIDCNHLETTIDYTKPPSGDYVSWLTLTEF